MVTSEALTIASRAIDHFLTGAPGKEKFSLTDISDALAILYDRDNRKGCDAGHKYAWDTGLAALWKLKKLLTSKRFNKITTRRLQKAQQIMPHLITFATQNEAAYWQEWQEITAQAVAEAEAIIAGHAAGGQPEGA